MRASRSPILWSSLLALAGCNEINITTVDVTDAFQQSPFEKVDVLLIVDNSCSMQPYQEKLGGDFGGFFDFFADGEVDWRLAVAHTDSESRDFGEIRGPIITADAADPEAQFAEVVNVGTTGGGIEAGLAAAVGVLEDAGNGFPRDQASVSVIYVSDEEDASPLTVAEYVNRYYDLRGQRQREAFNASALTVSELADCDPEQFASSAPGNRYIEVARLTGGISGNLCVDDFEQIVLDLALTTSTLFDTFYLRARPDLNTLTLRIEDEPVDCTDGTWRYELVQRDGREVPAIVFEPDAIPAAGTELLVEYQRGDGDPEKFCPEASE